MTPHPTTGRPVERRVPDPLQLDCPRCGYDLSGQPGSWSDACPLNGVCSECGLPFEWSDVLVNPGWRVSWLYESDTPARFKLIKTGLRTVLPGFWCRLPLALPIRHDRLVRFSLLWLLILCAGWSLVGAASVMTHTYSWSLSRLFSQLAHFGAGRVTREFRPALLPLVSEIRFAGVRTRAGVPTLVFLEIALLMPIVFLVLDQTFAAAKVRRAHIFRALAYSLPRVIAGASAASLAWGLVLLQRTWTTTTPIFSSVMSVFAGAFTVAAALALALWWRSFAVHYLRIRHANAVVIVAMGVAFLATATLNLVLIVLMLR